MTTFKRVCLETKQFCDGEKSVTLERGREYLTSKEEDGEVLVLTTYWFWVPVSMFAGGRQFTGMTAIAIGADAPAKIGRVE